MATAPVYPVLPAPEAAAPVAICYLTGEFNSIPTAPGGPQTYSDIIVVVNESTGAVILNAARPDANWPFAAPPTTGATGATGATGTTGSG